MSRLVLLISGGALRGPFSVPILEHVYREHGEPDEIGGTSIGALHAALLSAGDVGELRPVWMRTRKRKQMLHAPLDIGRGGIRDGIISMDRGRAILERAIDGRPFRIPVHVGIADAATGEVRQVPITHAPLHQALDNVFASASLAPAMELARYWWQGQQRWGYDGGLFEVLPRARGILRPGDRVVAVFHSPATPKSRREELPQERVGTSWGLLGAQLDDIVDRAVLERDIPYLRGLVDRGVHVDVYAPESWGDVGPSWTYGEAWRDHRLAAGTRAVVRGPLTL